jgi:hypothetical protein
LHGRRRTSAWQVILPLHCLAVMCVYVCAWRSAMTVDYNQAVKGDVTAHLEVCVWVCVCVCVCVHPGSTST